jgi:hypothetical protein
MRSAKLNGSTKISQSSEIDVGGNIHELLVRASHATHQASIAGDEIAVKATHQADNAGDEIAVNAMRQAYNAGDEIAVNSVAPFLHRISEASRREIKHLVDALQTLDEKLQTDGDRIQRDIEEYTELSKHVLQLTTIVSDSVNSLPTTSGNSYAS